MPGVEAIIWEHGRRNFALRADGVLAIVCPVADGSEVNGLGIFTTSAEETTRIMDEDPGVKAGVFVYEIHPCRGFPGSSLPSVATNHMLIAALRSSCSEHSEKRGDNRGIILATSAAQQFRLSGGGGDWGTIGSA